MPSSYFFLKVMPSVELPTVMFHHALLSSLVAIYMSFMAALGSAMKVLISPFRSRSSPALPILPIHTSPIPAQPSKSSSFFRYIASPFVKAYTGAAAAWKAFSAAIVDNSSKLRKVIVRVFRPETKLAVVVDDGGYDFVDQASPVESTNPRNTWMINQCLVPSGSDIRTPRTPADAIASSAESPAFVTSTEVSTHNSSLDSPCVNSSPATSVALSICGEVVDSAKDAVAEVDVVDMAPAKPSSVPELIVSTLSQDDLIYPVGSDEMDISEYTSSHRKRACAVYRKCSPVPLVLDHELDQDVRLSRASIFTFSAFPFEDDFKNVSDSIRVFQSCSPALDLSPINSSPSSTYSSSDSSDSINSPGSVFSPSDSDARPEDAQVSRRAHRRNGMVLGNFNWKEVSVAGKESEATADTFAVDSEAAPGTAVLTGSNGLEMTSGLAILVAPATALNPSETTLHSLSKTSSGTGTATSSSLNIPTSRDVHSDLEHSSVKVNSRNNPRPTPPPSMPRFPLPTPAPTPLSIALAAANYSQSELREMFRLQSLAHSKSKPKPVPKLSEPSSDPTQNKSAEPESRRVSLLGHHPRIRNFNASSTPESHPTTSASAYTFKPHSGSRSRTTASPAPFLAYIPVTEEFACKWDPARRAYAVVALNPDPSDPLISATATSRRVGLHGRVPRRRFAEALTRAQHNAAIAADAAATTATAADAAADSERAPLEACHRSVVQERRRQSELPGVLEGAAQEQKGAALPGSASQLRGLLLPALVRAGGPRAFVGGPPPVPAGCRPIPF